MRFEWDAIKNQANFKKHGLNFETACEAFNDPKAIRKFDRIVGTETRLHLIAKVRNITIILIVFTERNENYRIISARQANKDERNEYYEKND